MRSVPLLFGFCVALLSSFPAHAQSNTVGGVVVDSTGGVVRGATVTLRPKAGGQRETVSDAGGQFAFDNVPNGPANVTVNLQRFAPTTVDVDGAQTDLRLVLRPLAVSELVTVRAPSQNETAIRTATKTDTPLRDVPQAVSIITRGVIADQAMTSVADVTRYVPGVGFAQGEGNRDTPILRGNSSTADFLVDGVRDDVQYFRDLYNVERVEALKGPNAMIFGRGGVGGVINRVTRQADWMTYRELGLQLGSWGNRRLTGDIGKAVSDTIATRVTGVFEDSDSYRDGVGLERYGINPTVAFTLGANTTLRAAYEYFHDDRTADRGIPSFAGRPVRTDPSTFFGNAADSHSIATVNSVSSVLEHKFNGRFMLRNRISYADYDKFYQNVYPIGLDAAGTTVSISAYNNGTWRHNLFNQADLTLVQRTGRLEHSVLFGSELGRQVTDNRRLTGFFSSISPTTTSLNLPIGSSTTTLPVEFRPSATDADNHGVATIAAVYVQDQVTFSQDVQAIVGLRYESFSVDFHNNRTVADLSSDNGLVSPRLGIVYKPLAPVSFYTSYSMSYLPRAGEQLSSLSLTNQALDPEQYRNYEVGAKWDILPALSFTSTIYRLDRSNVAVPDPVNPAASILVDAQRTKGLELGLSGNVTSAWSILGAYAYQRGEITQSISATAQAGAHLAQLPPHSFSLWNKYDVSRRFGVGLGVIHRGDVFTSTDNTVTLPKVTRADAALFVNLTGRLRAQVNLENVFDEAYYAYAHSNSNITPGSPRAIRVAVTSHF